MGGCVWGLYTRITVLQTCHIYISICTYTPNYTHTHTHMPTYTHTRRTHTHAHTHTHTRIHTHTHAHTHTHTQRYAAFCWSKASERGEAALGCHPAEHPGEPAPAEARCVGGDVGVRGMVESSCIVDQLLVCLGLYQNDLLFV